MKLELERVGPHLVGPAVETLEPRVVRVDALERHLQAEPFGQCPRQRSFSRSDHSRDADQHANQPKKRGVFAKRLCASCYLFDRQGSGGLIDRNIKTAERTNRSEEHTSELQSR